MTPTVSPLTIIEARQQALGLVRRALRILHTHDEHTDTYKILEKGCAKLETLAVNHE